MTDRELIQYAAIAAGMPTKTIDGKVFYCNASGEVWSPLSDDGDALRLAVTLGMDLQVYNGSKNTTATERERFTAWSEPHGLDPYAATRRAIVLAAAEIGRSMVAKA